MLEYLRLEVKVLAMRTHIKLTLQVFDLVRRFSLNHCSYLRFNLPHELIFDGINRKVLGLDLRD